MKSEEDGQGKQWEEDTKKNNREEEEEEEEYGQ